MKSSNNNNEGQRITHCLRRIIKGRMRAAGFDSERLTAHSPQTYSDNASFINRISIARSAAVCKTQQYQHYTDICPQLRPFTEFL
jgi:hypothetical protein